MLRYDRIRKMDNVYQSYCQKLIKEGVVDKAYIDEQEAAIIARLEEAFAEAKTWEFKVSDWLDSRWEGFKTSEQLSKVATTGTLLNFVEIQSYMLNGNFIAFYFAVIEIASCSEKSLRSH